MGVYIMETFVIEESNGTEPVEVTAGGQKVLFATEHGVTWFELSKEEWNELKEFVDAKI